MRMQNNCIKYFSFVVLMFLVLGLVACHPACTFLDYNELKTHCIKVDLIDYNNPNATIITNAELIQPIDLDNVKVLYELPVESCNAFFKDLASVELFLYREFSQFYDSANGQCIRLSFDDDSFIILSSQENHPYDNYLYDIVAKFDSEGKLLESIGLFSWHPSYFDLINKYFNV